MKTIDVISIPVSDQQRSKEFYKKLGFEILVETPMGNDQTWIQMGFPGSATSVTLVNWFKKMPAGSMQGFVIKTDDLKKEIENLNTKGVKVQPVEDTPWGMFATIIDPDGNGLSLHEKK